MPDLRDETIADPFKLYRTDILFLLVGANPLPNYVAARLLVKDKGTVVLLHSERTERQKRYTGTTDVAKRLEIELKKSCPHLHQIKLYGVAEADHQKVIKKMKEEIIPDPDLQLTGKSIGLNYTGGTKPMSIAAYDTLRAQFRDICLSYVDARTLSMVVHRENEAPQTLPIGQRVEVSLDQLFSMHGYSPQHSNRLQRNPDLYQAIATVHSTTEGFKAWREWLSQCSQKDSKPLSLLNETEFSPLEEFVKALTRLNEGRLPTEEQLAKLVGFQRLDQCWKYLLGEWLEDYVFEIISQFGDRLGINDAGVSLSAKKTEHSLEMDVAAMRGYQFFAISCQATDNKRGARFHLFEALVRARQLGGDEARAALVCLFENPNHIQNQVADELDAFGKVRVFGRHDLLNLEDDLAEWISTAS